MKTLLSLVAMAACTAAMAQSSSFIPDAGYAGPRPSRPSTAMTPSTVSTPGNASLPAGSAASPGQVPGAGAEGTTGTSGSLSGSGTALSGRSGTTPMSGGMPEVGVSPSGGALMHGASLAGVSSSTMLGGSGSSLATMPSSMSQGTLQGGTTSVCPPGMFNTGLGCSSPGGLRPKAGVSR